MNNPLTTHTSFALPPKDQLKIATSIQPLAAITADILGTQSNISVLLPAHESLHHHQFKPSDVKAINDADLLIWLGPNAEPHLEQLLQTRHKTKKQLVIEKISNLQWLPQRKRSHWYQQQKPVHSTTEKAGPAKHDVHIWLDPLQTIIIAEHINLLLGKLQPDQKQVIEKNYMAFKQDLEQQTRIWQQQLLAANIAPILFWHDAWQYFTNRFSLPITAAITDDSEQSPSIYHLMQIKHLITTQQSQCAIVAPSHYSPKILNKLFEAKPTLVELDPVAVKELPSAFASTGTRYRNWINYFIQEILKCRRPAALPSESSDSEI